MVGLPAGYECPEGYFVNATKCLECPERTKWNGTDCLTDDSKIILFSEAAPVKIDPTVAKPIVENVNATSQDQCGKQEYYFRGRCLRCPEGSTWNGALCKINEKPSLTDE